MKKYARFQFMYELSDEAMRIYSNSDIVFYTDANGVYYAGYTVYGEPFFIGSLADVEKYLLSFLDE